MTEMSMLSHDLSMPGDCCGLLRSLLHLLRNSAPLSDTLIGAKLRASLGLFLTCCTAPSAQAALDLGFELLLDDRTDSDERALEVMVAYVMLVAVPLVNSRRHSNIVVSGFRDRVEVADGP